MYPINVKLNTKCKKFMPTKIFFETNKKIGFKIFRKMQITKSCTLRLMYEKLMKKKTKKNPQMRSVVERETHLLFSYCCGKT